MCIEALASKVPVIASDVGGIPEVVLEKETGFLISSGDSNIISKKSSHS